MYHNYQLFSSAAIIVWNPGSFAVLNFELQAIVLIGFSEFLQIIPIAYFNDGLAI